MRSLCDSLKTNDTLKHLDICLNKVGDEGTRYLCETLKINSNLEELNLYQTANTHFGSKILSDTLTSNTSLKKLWFSGDLGDSELEKFCESLKINKTLKSFHFWFLKVKRRGLLCLSELINYNTTLESLHFGCDQMENETIDLICENLEKNQNLKSINLPFEFKEYGTQKIINLLFKNSSLLEIELDEEYEDDFPIDSKNKINFLLDCNQQWNPLKHSSYFKEFKVSVFSFLLCLQQLKKRLFFKLPRFVLYEILKRINRKSFFDQYFKKKRKRDSN